MTFAWPFFLWLLIGPAAWAAREFARKGPGPAEAHPRILRAEAGARSIEFFGKKPPETGGPARRKPRIWLVAGVALTIVALARPQWGRRDEAVFDQAREVVVAVDLSRSMLAEDVKPSRLDRAKLLAEALLDRLAGERVGLVVFAGTAFLQAPLSTDYEILRDFLPALGPDFLPEGGTGYAALIDTAAAAFSGGHSADRFLIVLSDGGATDEDWRSQIPRLTEKGIRVIGLGIGTAKGSFIPDGSGGFMKDDRGAVVLAKLESDTLRELAEKTGGTYRDAGEWVDLAGVLRATVEAGRKGRFAERNTVRYVERFQWALAPALLCLIMSLLKEFPVRPKPRDIRVARGAAMAAAVAAALFPAALARAAMANGDHPPPPGVLLGRIVGRISSIDRVSALDLAELARETVSWGRAIRSGGERVPAGPVNDGLGAVDAGSALDRSAADWARLREDLRDLLKNPEEKKQPPSPQQQQPQEQQRQNQRRDDQKQPNPAESRPTEPPDGKQEIGGAERRTPEAERMDSSLAVPLDKLDQVKNQDSPVELYRMFENNEPRPPPTTGKNW